MNKYVTDKIMIIIMIENILLFGFHFQAAVKVCRFTVCCNFVHLPLRLFV